MRGIQGCSVTSVKHRVPNATTGSLDTSTRWVVDTDGANLREARQLKTIDTRRTRCSDIPDVYRFLGPDAAEAVIEEELKMVIKNVDPRHHRLVARTMCHWRFPRGNHRNGVPNEVTTSDIAKAMFEAPLRHFTHAGVNAKCDKMKGLPERGIMGQALDIGAAQIQVIPADIRMHRPALLQPLQPLYGPASRWRQQRTTIKCIQDYKAAKEARRRDGVASGRTPPTPAAEHRALMQMFRDSTKVDAFGSSSSSSSSSSSFRDSSSSLFRNSSSSSSSSSLSSVTSDLFSASSSISSSLPSSSSHSPFLTSSSLSSSLSISLSPSLLSPLSISLSSSSSVAVASLQAKDDEDSTMEHEKQVATSMMDHTLYVQEPPLFISRPRSALDPLPPSLCVGLPLLQPLPPVVLASIESQDTEDADMKVIQAHGRLGVPRVTSFENPATWTRSETNLERTTRIMNRILVWRAPIVPLRVGDDYVKAFHSTVSGILKPIRYENVWSKPPGRPAIDRSRTIDRIS